MFNLLASNNINVDIIVRASGEDIEKSISFSIKTDDLDKTLNILNTNLNEINAKEILHTSNFTKISIIGIGMIATPGVAAKMFEALYENNINIHMISTSEIKVSVLVNSEKSDLAMKSIHHKFFGN